MFAKSLAYPFGGLVLNLGVATDGHRDVGDKRLCVVIPFGEWDGGELCLFEAGIVVQMKAWDFIVFPSADITHFNLHFSGRRASVVLHSDKSMEDWKKERNGWEASQISGGIKRNNGSVDGLQVRSRRKRRKRA
jgi:hypothetical protein